MKFKDKMSKTIKQNEKEIKENKTNLELIYKLKRKGKTEKMGGRERVREREEVARERERK